VALSLLVAALLLALDHHLPLLEVQLLVLMTATATAHSQLHLPPHPPVARQSTMGISLREVHAAILMIALILTLSPIAAVYGNVLSVLIVAPKQPQETTYVLIRTHKEV